MWVVWCLRARRVVSEPTVERLAPEPDDLKAIKGIGPKLEQSLNDQGITTWSQIAALTPADVERVESAIKIFPGRVERDDWIGQATALTTELASAPGEPSATPPR